jgi:hypothetical protein
MMGAGKFAGKVLTKIERASMPPAEEPTTTSLPVREVVISLTALITYLLLYDSFCACSYAQQILLLSFEKEPSRRASL